MKKKTRRSRFLDRVAVWTYHHVIIASIIAAVTHGPFGIITLFWLLTKGVLVEARLEEERQSGQIVESQFTVLR